MSEDLIKRSDAIRAIRSTAAQYVPFLNGVNETLPIECEIALRSVPSAKLEIGDYPNDLISRSALMEYCSNQKSKSIDNNDIARFPSVKAAQGEWIDKGWNGDWQFQTDGRGNSWHEYECSECGFHNKGGKSNFCPSCGAAMKQNL